MHQFGEHDIGDDIYEQLGVEGGTMGVGKAAAEQGSETTTSNKLSA
jgi:hypothetical protein